MKEKYVSKSLISIAEIKQEVAADKREKMQISGDAEDVELNGVKRIKIDKELEQGEDVIEKREEVQKSVTVHKITEMQISGNAVKVQLEEVAKENDTTVDKTREMQISGEEEFKLKEVAEEKGTSIKGVELGKEADLGKDDMKAVLVITEENDVSVHEVELSVASILVQERKEEIVSKSRKHKRELDNL